MKNLIFLFIFSLSYGNFSYQSLLLPNSTYDLVSGNSKYSIFEPSLIMGVIFRYIDLQFSLGYAFTRPSDIVTSEENINGWQYGVIVNFGIFKE